MTVSLMKKPLGLVYLLAPRFSLPLVPELRKAVLGQATLKKVEFKWGDPNQVGEWAGWDIAKEGQGERPQESRVGLYCSVVEQSKSPRQMGRTGHQSVELQTTECSTPITHIQALVHTNTAVYTSTNYPLFFLVLGCSFKSLSILLPLTLSFSRNWCREQMH